MPKPLINADGLLLQWGDRLFYEPVCARKAPRASRGAWSGTPSALRAQIERTVQRVPEVMVKITNRPGTRNGLRAIRAHLDYISRHGQVELEDQDGNTISGRGEVQDLVQMWRVAGRGIAEASSKREAFNVMLSMPPGTDRGAVKDAARAFAREEFGEQRDYVFAAHDDEAHPHVHIVVLARGRDSRRLNPRKADLQRWRERFAQELRDRGVEANATPRRTRGVTQPFERQEVRHMRERGVTMCPRRELFHDPQVMFDVYLTTLSAWRAVASVLAESPRADERGIARAIAGFVRTMPVVVYARGLTRSNSGYQVTVGGAMQSAGLPDQEDSPDIEH
ncbi:relaxase/mobilization nuclease domain-containing protein [Paraburkholderia lycopersici]|uniref:Relaxase/Mobilisation nuclease domain-containing protein n=1 Tax=Paraburkholderia lycopersici TaxID=416944 RepID=A0A1G7A2W8_9BURK|nr:relaxase/mobilization nuclease domain-containing protein [Paraburkholderia lycopersici]SDE09288.1 Relaxase/Mobilisation nuclease domain-containing protein [Paraburkholderia lycopersici]